MAIAVIKIILLALLFLYIVMYARSIADEKEAVFKFEGKLKYGLVGLITNFFDFLGIGSYAPQMMILERDENFNKDSYLIPGTLNVSNYIPTVVQAFIVITILDIELLTLIVLPLCAAAGSFIASRYIKKKNEKQINIILAIALVVTAVILVFNAFDIPPFNNIETTLNGLSSKPILLILASISFFLLGMLQSFGLGIYGPGFAILGLMGVSYVYIIPINMLSSTVLSLSNSIEFISKDKYIKPVSLYVLVFGVIGVVLAASFSLLIDFSKIIEPLQVVIAIVAILGASKIISKMKVENKQRGEQC